MSRKIGIISYNIYGNFTNYGSALQSWALHRAVASLGYEPILIDYCPDVLADKNPLQPFRNMWDKDEETLEMCKMSLPAIRENYLKFENFYNDRFYRTARKYTSANFDEVVNDESIDGFICGSDTIFCINEFGVDDGFFANYKCMKKRTVAYAASFGDSTFSDSDKVVLNNRLNNFLSLGLRENLMIRYAKEHTNVPVQRTIDPTLLFSRSKYEELGIPEKMVEGKYILYYSRRYSKDMEDYVENLARDKGWKVVEISLRATNVKKGHIMFYNAGVEEFLSLVKHSEFVVTNSFHGMIFAVQYEKPFVIYSRELCNNKIEEILELLGLQNRLIGGGRNNKLEEIDYENVYSKISQARDTSLLFLKKEIEML